MGKGIWLVVESVFKKQRLTLKLIFSNWSSMSITKRIPQHHKVCHYKVYLQVSFEEHHKKAANRSNWGIRRYKFVYNDVLSLHCCLIERIELQYQMRFLPDPVTITRKKYYYLFLHQASTFYSSLACSYSNYINCQDGCQSLGEFLPYVFSSFADPSLKPFQLSDKVKLFQQLRDDLGSMKCGGLDTSKMTAIPIDHWTPISKIE